MSVYVDNMRAPYRGMIMCHMAADSTAELLAMAVAIGVNPMWLQQRGTREEHFDVSLSKRALAIEHGAIAVTSRQLVLRMLER